MEEISPAEKPFELLGMMSPAALEQVTTGLDTTASSAPATQETTTAYIQVMYYAALANLYVQSILPDTLKAMGGDVPPRLRTTLDRSYADYTSSTDWLAKNGGDFIASSPAKLYYEEVSELERSLIVTMDTFLAQNQ